MEMLSTSEAYLEPCQIGLKFLPVPILQNTFLSSVIDIWQGSEFAFDHDTVTFVFKLWRIVSFFNKRLTLSQKSIMANSFKKSRNL